jgi:hypothetical protein
MIHPMYLLSILNVEIKHKVNDDENNFLHFQCIKCTNFKIEFPFHKLNKYTGALFSIFL